MKLYLKGKTCNADSRQLEALEAAGWSQINKGIVKADKAPEKADKAPEKEVAPEKEAKKPAKRTVKKAE